MIYKNEVELPKNRRRKAQIERILDMAMKIVTSDGAEALTMQRLADKVDFTAGALYRYYSSKDEIIAELQIKCIQELDQAFDLAKIFIETNFKDAPISTKDYFPLLLLVTLGDILEFFSINESVKFSFLTNFLTEPKVMVNEVYSAKVAEVFKSLFLKIVFLFIEASNKKLMLIGNHSERALVYLSSLQGVLQLRKLSRVDGNLFNSTSLKKSLTNSLFLGWGVPENALAELATLKIDVSHFYHNNMEN